MYHCTMYIATVYTDLCTSAVFVYVLCRDLCLKLFADLFVRFIQLFVFTYFTFIPYVCILIKLKCYINYDSDYVCTSFQIQIMGVCGAKSSCLIMKHYCWRIFKHVRNEGGGGNVTLCHIKIILRKSILSRRNLNCIC